MTCYSIITLLLSLFVCSGYRDAKCGKIQCQGGANRPVIGTNAVSIETNIPLQEGGRILCRGTHVYLGDDMPDPGLVLTGTKCGTGMVRAEGHRSLPCAANSTEIVDCVAVRLCSRTSDCTSVVASECLSSPP